MVTESLQRQLSNKMVVVLAFFYMLVPTIEIIASGSAAGLSRSPDSVVSLESFGAHPNDPGLNSRLPFQQALEKLRTLGGGTLSIPAGDYYLDFPDIANDVDPRDPGNKALLQAKVLKREKVILVPKGVTLQGALDSSGNPATRIHWHSTSFPLLSFVSSDNSGAVNLAFVFDGVQPQFFPWVQEDFLEAVGYKSRWLGGPYEISTVIYTIGSSNLRFTNLTFESGKKPPDNQHTFAYGIVSNGKTPVPQPDPNSFKALPFGTRVPGGGLSDCVTGNNFRSLRFRDYVMGIFAIGQCRAIFENIEGHNRGSWFRSFDPSHESGPLMKNIGPPGHLVYLSFQNAYDVERSQGTPAGLQVFHSTARNKDVELRNITEGAETLSNVNSLGTLALKNMEGGVITNVVSRHPAGLIQSMVDAHDVQLEHLNWTSDRDICAERQDPTYCGIPIIEIVPGPESPGMDFNSGLQFRDIKLQSPRCSKAFNVSEETGRLPLSRNIAVDGLTIECSPALAPGQGSPLGIITVRTDATHFANVHFIPRTPPDATSGQLDYPAIIRSRSSDTIIEITVAGGRDERSNSTAFKCVIEGQQSQSSVSATNNKCMITTGLR